MSLSPAMQRVFAQAINLRDQGRWEAAAQAALAVNRAVPGVLAPALVAAEALLHMDRYRAMREVVLDASRQPVAPDELLPLVRWLRRLEESETLEALVSTGDWRAIQSPDALAELALHAGTSGLYGLADDITAHGLARHPMHPDLHYLLGLHRMFAGETAGSVAALERALELQPGMANAYLLIALQDPAEGGRRHIAPLSAALERTGQPEHQAYLGYALHHFLDAAGDYRRAWHALSRAHAACRQLAPYDRAREASLFDALHAMRLPETTAEVGDSQGPGLIFIVGMFRSGTSMIERVVCGSPHVLDGGETFTFSACMRQATDHDSLDAVDEQIVGRAGRANFDTVRHRMQRYARWRAGPRTVLTEKLPSNFLNLGFIMHALPGARIVHMRRDPMDTCFSNLRTFFGGSVPYACDQSDLADYYTRYRRLMAHWHQTAPGRILDVHYSDFIADPDGKAREVMAFCGLDYSPDALELGRAGGVSASASAAQVRQGVLKGRGGAWQRYAGHLQQMREGLGLPDS